MSERKLNFIPFFKWQNVPVKKNKTLNLFSKLCLRSKKCVNEIICYLLWNLSQNMLFKKGARTSKRNKRENSWNRRIKTTHCRRYRCSIKSWDTLSYVLLITLDKIYLHNFRIFDDFFIRSKSVIFFKNGQDSMIFSAVQNSLEWISITFIQRVWMRHCNAKENSVLALLV